MSSAIDATIPADNKQVSKSDMRANFAAAKAEISALIIATSYARKLALNGLARTTI